MKNTKRLVFIVSAILFFSLISLVIFKISRQRKPEPEAEAKLILGFSQIGSESAWRTRNTESIFEAAAENNIQVIFDDAQQKQSNQLKAIRSFIVYQVDVIAFVPIVEDGWDNVLQEAKEAGIPVILVDRQINADESMYAGFLGEDGFEQGQRAARFLLEKTKYYTNDKINIVEFSGTEYSSVATSRSQGFRNILAGKDKYNIIYSKDGDFLTSRGKEMMDEIIHQNNGLRIGNDHIDVIYSHNDSMTLGLLDSLSENHITPKNTIIISIDAEQKCIDALVDGKLNCVVECNPNSGPTLMHLVQEIAAGNPIPRVTYMEEQVFTENDDFSTYTPRGY